MRLDFRRVVHASFYDPAKESLRGYVGEYRGKEKRWILVANPFLR